MFERYDRMIRIGFGGKKTSLVIIGANFAHGLLIDFYGFYSIRRRRRRFGALRAYCFRVDQRALFAAYASGGKGDPWASDASRSTISVCNVRPEIIRCRMEIINRKHRDAAAADVTRRPRTIRGEDTRERRSGRRSEVEKKNQLQKPFRGRALSRKGKRVPLLTVANNA